MSRFVHLHVHSHYSLLDGLGKIPELINRAKELDMDALALTDHGVLYGAIEFYQEAQKAGIKPIIGVEAYVAPRTLHDRTPKIDSSPYHIILLAKDLTGYKNLLKLTSIAHLDGFYYKPRIDIDTLRQHSKGLIACTACLAGIIPQKIINRDWDGAKKVALELSEIFGKDNLYLELQHHPTIPEQAKVNEGLIKLSKELNLPLIATNDIHYVRQEDKETHETLIAVNTGKDLDSKDRMTLSDLDLFMQPPEFYEKNFSHVPEAISNTAKIAEQCNLKIPLDEMLIPHFPVPQGETETTYLEKLCHEGVKKRYDKITPEIKQRLDYELKTIERMGFPSYFLIVADFVNWAKNQGILVGPGRGSAAGSIVSYVLNITDLDPLQYGMMFERFLNPDRISMPDIDMDFADDRRVEVIQYVRQKYGDDHVAGIITYGTMMSRAAVRDVGRALGMSYGEVDVIAKQIPPPVQGRHIPLRKSLQSVPELKKIYESDPQAKRLLDLASNIEGTVRHASQHACAIVISKDPLTEYVPLQQAQKGDVGQVTQYSMKPIEAIGLLKMDFLGLANLTIMQNAIKIIEAVHGDKIDIDHLPLDDPKAYELLGKGETTGVFQLESAGMKRYIKELKPRNLSEIAIMVALYRPGPMQFIESFINRRHGKENVEYLHPLTENGLKETYGIPIYQEQVMQVSRDMAGFTGGEADTLRKAMGKKIAKLMKEMRTKFIEGSINNGVSKDIATKIFTQFEEFAAYGFNKSHAVCYAYIAYQTAYLKSKYPSCFMAALMTSDFQNIDRISIEIEECKHMGIKVLPPDVNESFVEFGVVKESQNIRFGLSAIKNVGVGVAKAIVAERKKNGPFETLEDFAGRLGSSVINKKVLEALTKTGAMEKFGERSKLLGGVEAITKYASEAEKRAQSNQMDLFGSSAFTSSEVERLTSQPSIPLPNIPPADKKQRLAWEKELLGIYISEHPLQEVQDILPRIATPVKELSENDIGKVVRVGGIITSVRKILTKKQEPMLFLKLEDLNSALEVVVFPRLYEKVALICQPDNVVIIEGKVNYRDGELKLTSDDIEEIGRQETFADLEKKQQFVVRGKANPRRQRSSTPQPSPLTPLRQPADSPLILTIPKGSKKDILDQLKVILETAPGSTPIVLRVPINSHYKEMKTRTRVSITDELNSKLASIISQENIALPS